MFLHNVRTFESFKTPAYRVYYISMVGQWLTQSMQILVRSLLVFRISGSAASIGIVALAMALPALMFSLLGGAIADRVPKKYLLTIGRASLAVVALSNGLLITGGYLGPQHPGSWWILAVSAFLQGTAMGFTQPALMSIIPELVSEKRVMNALALSTVGQNLLSLAGPALAGFMIDSYGFATLFYLMTGLYLMDTVWTLFLPKTHINSTRKGNPITDIIDAFRYVRQETFFLLLVLFMLSHVIAGLPYQQMMPVFTTDVLHVSASKLGILTSFAALGSLSGAFIFASMPNKRRGLLLILSGIVMGMGIILLSLSHVWYIALIFMPICGLGPTMAGTMNTTIIQAYAKPEYRGRMQGFSSTVTSLGSLGTFLAGVLSDTIGVQWSLRSMALFLLLITFIYLVFAGKVRKLE